MFIRELISNASDALERLRYLQLKGEIAGDEKTTLEIHIATDDVKKTFTIQVNMFMLITGVRCCQEVSMHMIIKYQHTRESRSLLKSKYKFVECL